MSTKIFLKIVDYSTIVITIKVLSLIFQKIKKVIEKFKDEAAGLRITEFVGLKSKMHFYTTEKNNKKAAKGVKMTVLDRDIDHFNYLDMLNKNRQMRHKMKTIRSELHEIYSCQMNKISL